MTTITKIASVVCLTMVLGAGPAHAGPRSAVAGASRNAATAATLAWHRGPWLRGRVGLPWLVAPVIGAAVTGAVLAAHPFRVDYRAWAGPPCCAVSPPSPCCYAPPPPACCYSPPPVVYAAPPPVVYAAPPPPAVYAAPPPPEPEYRRTGVYIAGVSQAPMGQGTPLGGMAVGLQFRPVRPIALSIEGESLGAELLDGTRRRDLGLLGGLRLYLWDAPLTMFIDLAGGMAGSEVTSGGASVRAPLAIGKAGGGIEWRLGQRVVLDGRLVGVDRVRLDRPSDGGQAVAIRVPGAPAIEDESGALEARAALTVRF